jgi:hypothetical protein
MPEGYCASKGNSVSDEWIDLVSLGSINKVSAANGGYADFTSLSTGLSSGTSYTISFSTGFSGSSYTEYWRVWIDYNRDGDFADTGEQVASTSSSSSGTLSASFTVPAGVSAGPARMRVSMKYGSAPTSCETFSYGEVEDYAVVLSASKSDGTLADDNEIITLPQVESEIRIYPNPSDHVLNLQLPDGMMADVVIVNINGQEMKSFRVNAFARIDISELPAGIYLIKINDGKSISTERFIKE